LALPDAAYIISRYGATGDTATKLTTTYTHIVPVAFGIISASTELLIPSDDVEGERMDFSGKVDFLLPAKWPVTEIIKASFPSTSSPPNRPLRIASDGGLAQQEIFNGKADLAIGEDGETIVFSPWLSGGGWGGGWGGRGYGYPIFVDYHAGLDTLPADLLEVFCQLCWLIAEERTRVGKTSDRMDVAQTNFTRKLPDWARLALDGYKRVQVFV
jgi:hypothetical protein